MSSKRNDATSRRSRLGSKQSPVRKHTRFALSPTLSAAEDRRRSSIRRSLAENSSLGHRHYASLVVELTCPLVLVRMDCPIYPRRETLCPIAGAVCRIELRPIRPLTALASAPGSPRPRMMTPRNANRRRFLRSN